MTFLPDGFFGMSASRRNTTILLRNYHWLYSTMSLQVSLHLKSMQTF